MGQLLTEANIHMNIIITSAVKNSPEAVRYCIESVQRQTYRWWKHIIVAVDRITFDAANRVSDDQTSVLRPIQKEIEVLDNLLPIWRNLREDDIIVWLDGDDWLAVPYALEIILNHHKKGALCTYGQFLWPDGSPGFASKAGSSPRRHEKWGATHLRTFRAGLVQKINDSDFREPDGTYIKHCADLAVMWACLEMAPKHSVFIPNFLMVYNYDNSFENMNKNTEELQKREEAVERIRSLTPYKPVVDDNGRWIR